MPLPDILRILLGVPSMIAARMMEGCMIRRCCFGLLVAAGTTGYPVVGCLNLGIQKKPKKWFGHAI